MACRYREAIRGTDYDDDLRNLQGATRRSRFAGPRGMGGLFGGPIYGRKGGLQKRLALTAPASRQPSSATFRRLSSRSDPPGKDSIWRGRGIISEVFSAGRSSGGPNPDHLCGQQGRQGYDADRARCWGRFCRTSQFSGSAVDAG